MDEFSWITVARKQAKAALLFLLLFFFFFLVLNLEIWAHYEYLYAESTKQDIESRVSWQCWRMRSAAQLGLDPVNDSTKYSVEHRYVVWMYWMSTRDYKARFSMWFDIHGIHTLVQTENGEMVFPPLPGYVLVGHVLSSYFVQYATASKISCPWSISFSLIL